MFNPIYYIRSNYRHDPEKIRLVKAAEKAHKFINRFKRGVESITRIHLHRWSTWELSGGSYGLFTGEEHRRCKDCGNRQIRRY